MHASRKEVMDHLEPSLAEDIPKLTLDPEACWQPADYLPDLRTEEGFEAVKELREEAAALSDDVLVTLIGDMITEEALPSYSSWIAVMDGVDRMGVPRNNWGEWNRRWSSEENRHGDLLNKWLYLSGRVNMREVEVTIQHLIGDGGEIGVESDPYRTFVYTSFQEIATRISHLNVGLMARKAGAERLYKLCSRVAGDEHRHARAYKLFFSRILEVDTDEAVLALQDMMKKRITMPAVFMRERGAERGSTFDKFHAVAERTGIYTAHDYIHIVEDLVGDWNIGKLTGLSPAAAKAQDYLCNLGARYRRVVDRYGQKADNTLYGFTWLQDAQAAEPLA